MLFRKNHWADLTAASVIDTDGLLGTAGAVVNAQDLIDVITHNFDISEYFTAYKDCVVGVDGTLTTTAGTIEGFDYVATWVISWDGMTVADSVDAVPVPSAAGTYDNNFAIAPAKDKFTVYFDTIPVYGFSIRVYRIQGTSEANGESGQDQSQLYNVRTDDDSKFPKSITTIYYKNDSDQVVESSGILSVIDDILFASILNGSTIITDGSTVFKKTNAMTASDVSSRVAPGSLYVEDADVDIIIVEYGNDDPSLTVISEIIRSGLGYKEDMVV